MCLKVIWLIKEAHYLSKQNEIHSLRQSILDIYTLECHTNACNFTTRNICVLYVMFYGGSSKIIFKQLLKQLPSQGVLFYNIIIVFFYYCFIMYIVFLLLFYNVYCLIFIL